MIDENIKATVCKEALAVCRSRRCALVPQLFESTVAQLEWLIGYFEGRASERNGLFELTFGHYAAREIDPSEKELVEALYRAFYVAEQTRRGLKVDLKVLGHGA